MLPHMCETAPELDIWCRPSGCHVPTADLQTTGPRPVRQSMPGCALPRLLEGCSQHSDIAIFHLWPLPRMLAMLYHIYVVPAVLYAVPETSGLAD
eukprot:358229-Chlamydomonas_euryale.AAC.12